YMLAPSPSFTTNIEDPFGRMVLPQPGHGTTAGTTNDNENRDSIKCHPISQLPVEILSRIFLLCFSFTDLVQMPTAHPTAHVCELWKAIVTETPDFWATITNNSTESDIKLKLRKAANARVEVVYCPQELPGGSDYVSSSLDFEETSISLSGKSVAE
ncbi:hypothetical protein FRC00_001221, partial [Tulasnella sp. 408]